MRFLLISWSSKNGNYIFQSLNYVDINWKLWFLIKSSYYIVPSASSALDFIWGIIDDYPGFQPKTTFLYYFAHDCNSPFGFFFGLLVSSWRESTVSVVFQDLKFKTTSVFSWPTRHRRLEKSSHTTGNFVLHVPWIKPACMNHLLNRNIDHASKTVDFKYGIVASSSTHY